MKRKSKEIFGYLIRVCLFILLNRNDNLLPIYKLLFPAIDILLGGDGSFLTVFIVAYLELYILAKLCGLFKRLDSLNFFISLIIAGFIDVLFTISISTRVQIFPLKFSYSGVSSYLPTVIVCFVLYKIFYFLGKKFPNTFGKIGYYSSIKFWKKLILKK